MRKVHFFKAYSRIGIHNLPHGQSIKSNGVEEAPDFILSESFLNKFPNSNVSSFGFIEPEDVGPLNYFQTIKKECIKFKKFLIQNHKRHETLVVIGGDHSVTFTSILYDLDTFGSDIGIIHFDSHGDINLYKYSPSKNFHGMYLRIFFDTFDLKYFDNLVKKKLSKEQMFFVGNLELDPEEKVFIEKNRIKNLSSEMIKKDPDSLKIMSDFIKKYNHIHISFDVDVFDQKLAPATGTPSRNGFKKKDIFKILDIIRKSKSLTVDLAEVNPRKVGSAKTISLAQEVLLALLS